MTGCISTPRTIPVRHGELPGAALPYFAEKTNTGCQNRSPSGPQTVRVSPGPSSAGTRVTSRTAAGGPAASRRGGDGGDGGRRSHTPPPPPLPEPAEASAPTGPPGRPSAYQPCRPRPSPGGSAPPPGALGGGRRGGPPPPPFPSATPLPVRAPRAGGSRPALPHTGNGHGGAPRPRRGGGSPALSCRLPSLRLHHSARSPLCRM